MTIDDSVAESESGGLNRRVVVVGASNVWRAVATVVDTACDVRQPPVDVYLAAGHGRSYGRRSWVLGRSLPGIVDCGLWSAVQVSTADQPAIRSRTTAVLTDIGNDLLYEVPVSRIVEWVEACVQQLSPIAESITLTELPLASVRRLGATRYLILRSLLFPRSRLSLSMALDRAEQLNEQVIALARRHDVSLVSNEDTWYGVDPIHVKQQYHRAAWQKFFSSTITKRERQPSWRRWLSLKTMRPLEQRVFGWQRGYPQPARRFADGASVWLY